MCWAAANGKAECVEFLADRGAEIDRQGSDDRWRTPLAWAAQNGHTDVVECLLAKKADLGAKDEDGNTAMSLAAEKGRWSTVRFLAAQGVDVPEEHRDQFMARTGKGKGRAR